MNEDLGGSVGDFGLDPDLEKLVNAAISAGALKERSQVKVNLRLIDDARAFYTTGVAKKFSSIDEKTFRTASDRSFESLLTDGEFEFYLALSKLLDADTFERARGYYLSRLNEESKLQFYVKMLERNIVSDFPAGDSFDAANLGNARKILNKVKDLVDYSAELSLAVRRRDSHTARNLVLDKDLEGPRRSILETYHGMNAEDAEFGVYSTIARGNLIVAKRALLKNNLFSFIDRGIETMGMGKSYALVSLHELYSVQEAEPTVRPGENI